MNAMVEKIECLSELTPQERDEFFAEFGPKGLLEWKEGWRYWANAGQIPPPSDWRVWLVMAGRGFGKTRAGAEWVRAVTESDPQARVALVAASLAEARSVMVEGESGILACCRPRHMPRYEPSLHRLIFPNGAQAFLYSAAEPESLRGPQHSHAWCDEVAKWPASQERATRAWDNLLLGLRLGKDQKIAATTTPRAVPLVQRLLSGEDSGKAVVTRGRTEDNKGNLAPGFVEAMRGEFGATALGRQELDGEMLAEVEGALWSRALLESCRIEQAPEQADRPFARIVIGVDPPASANGSECGIVVCGLTQNGEDKGVATVLADCSVAGASPESWARAVAQAARAWGADRVVAEANQGGAMVESVLRAADFALPLRLVHASKGKSARAEPVAALYETGRVRHAGMFAAITELMLGKRRLPRVWRF
jgi:phage terminase large subunit-like protein